MNLLQVLEKATALAKAGYLDAEWLEGKRIAIDRGERSVNMTLTYVEAYEAEKERLEPDGTAVRWGLARDAQSNLVAARLNARRYQEHLGFLQEEVERAVLRAQHKQAAAAREEART